MDGRESALIVAVPAADRVVGLMRNKLDSSAPLGVPAHITVLYPFMPPALVSGPVLADLATMFASVPSFELSLGSVGWFATEVVYLVPQPREVFRHLTAMVCERWPEWPPYGGAHPNPTPHLTVGDSEDYESMVEAAAAIEVLLPVETTVSEVDLIAGDTTPGSWALIASFTLG